MLGVGPLVYLRGDWISRLSGARFGVSAAAASNASAATIEHIPIDHIATTLKASSSRIAAHANAEPRPLPRAQRRCRPAKAISARSVGTPAGMATQAEFCCASVDPSL